MEFSLIQEHLKNMSEKDIPGMLTHLSRAQDYFTRSQKVEVFEGLVKSCKMLWLGFSVNFSHAQGKFSWVAWKP